MPFTYSIDGSQIHYQEQGTGPAVLLHHGIGQTGDTWRMTGLTDALATDFRLIIMDVRGHGRSDKPVISNAYDWPHLIGDILAVADAANAGKFNFLGYSMGGLAAYVLAQRVPERINSLILGAAGTEPNDYSPFDQVDGSDDKAFLSALGQVLGEPLPKELGAMVAASNDLTAIAAMFSNRNEEPDLAELPTAMHMPCFAWAGDGDMRFNTTKSSTALMPNAEFHTLENANHLQAFARCAELAPAMKDFLHRCNR